MLSGGEDADNNTIAIPKNGDFTGTDIVKIMKQHLRAKYEKYREYADEDLERSILSFLNEYVHEMKSKEEQVLAQNNEEQ